MYAIRSYYGSIHAASNHIQDFVGLCCAVLFYQIFSLFIKVFLILEQLIYFIEVTFNNIGVPHKSINSYNFV